MINKHVIALNRLLLAQEQLIKRKNRMMLKGWNDCEAMNLMNRLRKHSHGNLRKEDLFTCGFSKN